MSTPQQQQEEEKGTIEVPFFLDFAAHAFSSDPGSVILTLHLADGRRSPPFIIALEELDRLGREFIALARARAQLLGAESGGKAN